MKNILKDHEVISETAILYSTWNGSLTAMKGKVLHTKEESELAVFINEKGQKAVTCHSEPEQIYNAMVWLPEKQDNLAKNILMKYHEEKIEELKEKINGHLRKISLIRGGL